MSESVVLPLTLIVVLGVLSQWIASVIRVPSILLLLAAGFLAGPVTGFLDPDKLLSQELLQSVVSLSLAVILFEGGLSLRLSEAKSVGKTVTRLVTVGALVTWALCTAGARFILDMSDAMSALLGAILVLSGPTVIGPLLRHIRPVGKTGPILKWEGIVIDPVGALLAALVFHSLLSDSAHTSRTQVLIEILLTLGIGTVAGLLGVGILLLLYRRHWVHDHLQAPVALGVLLAFYSASNHLQGESGLLAATLMGFVLANQKSVTVRHITTFKEHLTIVLIACLFVTLAAQVPVQELLDVIFPRGLLFLLALLFVVRPVSVIVSTIGCQLSWRERAFLSWVCPRGIVAAAGAPFFALQLSAEGMNDADQLVPITFLVIAGTVAVYSLTSPWVARLLGLAPPDPQGVLMIGSHPLARSIAAVLKECNIEVALIDTNHRHIREARLAGLRAVHANVLADDTLDELDLGGIGNLLALTPNDEVNALAGVHGSHVFGRSHVFQLPPDPGDGPLQDLPAAHLRGRIAFSETATFRRLMQLQEEGFVVKRTPLSKDFDQSSFFDLYGSSALPLFTISPEWKLHLVEAGSAGDFVPGHTLVSLVKPPSEPSKAA